MCKTPDKATRPSRAPYLLRRLHHDERGTISLLTVFALLAFTFLLVMVVNVARHLDDKIRRQNAADAAAYSGGVVLARGMNAVAYTNHLLCDVFAVTAFLREGRDRNAEKPVPEILLAWKDAAADFQRAEFAKFQVLGPAIIGKTWKEQELVSAFSEMTDAASQLTLPVFEYILEEELIPEFQRTVIRTTPALARQAAGEIAFRHGLTQQELHRLESTGARPHQTAGRPPQAGLLWRANVVPLGQIDENDPLARTLPIVDPNPAGGDYPALGSAAWMYLETAVTQRHRLAHQYLEHWNADKLRAFDSFAKMSAFGHLWRIYTCAQLDKLLEMEYATSNLPMVIRKTEAGLAIEELQQQGSPQALRRHLDEHFHYVGVVYRRHLSETAPGLFRNPLAKQSDALTFAQISLFVPQSRYVRPRSNPSSGIRLGGSFGHDGGAITALAPSSANPGQGAWALEGWPAEWNLFNQNWTVQLVPATTERLPEILQSNPGGDLAEFRPPDLGPAGLREIKTINTH